ncbi:MAG: hypothetical protein C5B49_08755, partial [Bdellovibrio sp.]
MNQFNYQFVRGGGQTLALEEIAELGERGRRWVFLHGLMGYALNWRRIVSGLEANDVSFIFDQRGHGQSFKPEKGYAPEDFAEDLLCLVDELGWQKFFLVGHSMGGRNALVFASRHAERVRKLILEDIGPDGSMEAVAYYERLFAAVPTPFPSKLRAKEFFMNEFPRTAQVRGSPETLGLYLYSNIIERPDGSADWRFSKEAMIEAVRMGRARDHWSEFRSLSVPTLVLRGQHSEELSREVFSKLSQVNPRVQTVEVNNAGHWIHYDQWEVFIQLIKQFAESP